MSLQNLAETLQGYNLLEARTNQIIEEVPSLSNDRLCDVFRYAIEIGRQAWRLECAVCAAVVSRVPSQDTGITGAYIAEMASRLGITPHHLYRNAQIHALATTDTGLDVQTVLPEKSYYEEALRAPEPALALDLLAAKRGDNASYSVRDARRDVQAISTPAADVNRQREIFWLSVPLEPEERQLVNALCLHWGTDKAGAVKRALKEAQQKEQP